MAEGHRTVWMIFSWFGVQVFSNTKQLQVKGLCEKFWKRKTPILFMHLLFCKLKHGLVVLAPFLRPGLFFPKRHDISFSDMRYQRLAFVFQIFSVDLFVAFHTPFFYGMKIFKRKISLWAGFYYFTNWTEKHSCVVCVTHSKTYFVVPDDEWEQWQKLLNGYLQLPVTTQCFDYHLLLCV